MKKARWSVFLFILFFAFALTVKDEEEKTSDDSAGQASADESAAKKSSGYRPSLNVFTQAFSRTSVGVRTPTHTIKMISNAKGALKLGISKEKDMPKIGPGAFVFLKDRNAFVVLDNENNRLNFYPLNPSEKAYSLNYPANRQALGMTVDNRGQVTLLSRQYDATTGASYPTYEVWKLDENRKSQPWQLNRNFTFSDRATHGAAQSLEMQTYGNALLFKGLSENEFHYLGEGQNQTQKMPGYPTKNGTYIRTTVAENAQGVMQIQIEEFNRSGIVRALGTKEDMDRLTSYRLLSNGTLALDLEADDAQQLPREVVLINPKNGQVKARTELRRKDEVQVDQDLYFQENKVFQLAETPKGSAPEAANFEILQTEFGEEE